MTTLTAARRSPVLFRTDWFWIALALAVVILCWCSTYHRWNAAEWTTPLAYQGDAWSGLAGAKALASGEIWPMLPKSPASLGAPFVANWNDFPTIEEGLLAWWAIFLRLFGVVLGTNVTMLSAHLLAAIAFYVVCCHLGYNRVFGASAAVLFALSRYSFARGFEHMVLTFYWHVPLGLLVAWWCLSEVSLIDQRKKFIIALAVALLHGVQNVYYTWLFCQMLAFAALYHLLRRSRPRSVLSPLLIGIVAGLTFFLMNLDTFYFRWINGPPATLSVIRDYSGLEQYALKPVELFLPPIHAIRPLAAWAHRVYFDQALVRGEYGAAYLGIVGILSFGLVIWSCMRSFVSPRFNKTPCHFWGLVIILAYSVIGGVNSILGLFGIIFFRCTNRFSIVILAIVLLFLVRELSAWSRRWSILTITLVACALVAGGILDQLPPHASKKGVASLRAQMIDDSRMVADLEHKLPAAAMVFELPVMDFPEVPPMRGVQCYEEFRPYFFSHNLRFSYGSDKGRYRENWQRELAQLGTQGMVQRLETYGFSAILINRKGYEENGESLLAELRKANKTEVLSQTSDLIAIALTPSPHPELPPEFGLGWYPLEGDGAHNWKWADGDASIVMYSSQKTTHSVRVTFKLAVAISRHVSIEGPGGELYSSSLIGGGAPQLITFTVPLTPGRNTLRFRTDRPGELPGNGDVRKLAYAVHDFQISDL